MAKKRKNKSKGSGNTGQNKPSQPAPKDVAPVPDSVEVTEVKTSTPSTPERSSANSSAPSTPQSATKSSSGSQNVTPKSTSKYDGAKATPGSSTSGDQSPAATSSASKDNTSATDEKKVVGSSAVKESENVPDVEVNVSAPVSADTGSPSASNSVDSKTSEDSDDGFVKVSLPSCSDGDGSPHVIDHPNNAEDGDQEPITFAAKPSNDVVEAMKRRTSIPGPTSEAPQVSDKLKPAMHSLETDMKKQAVKAVLTPTLQQMQGEASGAVGSGSPFSLAQKQKREAMGVVSSTNTAPVIAAAANSVKTKIAGQELAKKVRRRPSAEELVIKGIMMNTDEVSADYDSEDPTAASYTRAPAPSPMASSAPPIPTPFSTSPTPTPSPFTTNSAEKKEKRRPSFTDTAEYNWLESLPKAKAKTPHATPAGKAKASSQSESNKAPPPSYVPYRIVERRVIVAVTLKVLAELKNRQILEADVVGTIKEKLFEDDEEIVKAVEAFVLSKNLELLIEAIYNAAGIQLV